MSTPPLPKFDCDVLLVEDDPMQCEEMAGYLSRVGLKVITASNGESALRLAIAHPPRVAIIDYNLPDQTGVDVAKKLRECLAGVSLMLVSGRIDSLPEETLKSVGISHFANKPLPLRPLRDAVLKLTKSGPATLRNLVGDNGSRSAVLGAGNGS